MVRTERTRAQRPLLLGLVGPSGAGKTTLAAALLRHWGSAGLRVGYVKHASHGFELDRPGKDSYRATEAGADGVVLAGPQGVAFLEPAEEADPRRLVERFLPGRDLVLLEGFRGAGLPSVVVVGRAGPATAEAEVAGPILARVRGADAPGALPEAFDSADVARLAAHLEPLLGLLPVRTVQPAGAV